MFRAEKLVVSLRSAIFVRCCAPKTKLFMLKNLNAYFERTFGEERWRIFVRNTHWKAASAAVVTAFVLFVLLRWLGDGMSVGRALTRGALYAAAVAGCWAAGVWVCGNGSKPLKRFARKVCDAASEQRTGVSCSAADDAPVSFSGQFWILLMAAWLLALFCWPQISGMLDGLKTPLHGFGSILLKLFAVAAFVIPMWLEQRRSE